MAMREQSEWFGREAHYAFACHRCRGCCRAKRIQVNPYEVARLARHFGLTTTAFLRRYTDGGVYLRFSEADVCLFLTGEGCGVHADRPLVCRLYPLGRHVSDAGEEWFTEFDAEPGCAGRRGRDQTVQAYLEEQGAVPFMRAADLYLELYWRLTARLEQEGAERGGGEAPAGDAWTDLDAAVGRYCRETRRLLPGTIEERMMLHIEAIATWAGTP